MRSELVKGAKEKSLRDTAAILKFNTSRAQPSIPTLEREIIEGHSGNTEVQHKQGPTKHTNSRKKTFDQINRINS